MVGVVVGVVEVDSVVEAVANSVEESSEEGRSSVEVKIDRSVEDGEGVDSGAVVVELKVVDLVVDGGRRAVRVLRLETKAAHQEVMLLEDVEVLEEVGAVIGEVMVAKEEVEVEEVSGMRRVFDFLWG